MAKGRKGAGGSDELRSRAVRLFEFLQHVVRQRERTIRLAEDFATRPPGRVLWFSALPNEPEVSSALSGELEDAWLTVDRPRRTDPPEPDEILAPHLDPQAIGDPEVPPAVKRQKRLTVRPDGGTETVLEEPPEEVRTAFEAYAEEWDRWALEELRRRPVRDLYGELFSIHQHLADSPEVAELVLGVGCLAWSPPEHPEVRRHLVVRKAVVAFDEVTGRITVSPDPAQTTGEHELDMLDQGRWPLAKRRSELDDELQGFEGNLLAEPAMQGHLRRWANLLDSDGRYIEELDPARPGPAATISFAPALIMRRRSNRTLLRVYKQILDDLESGKDEIPVGIRQLVDVVEDPEPRNGDRHRQALDEKYLPLPANREQLELVHRFASHDHVVVQGPPGTGKTHTIANLLCHLLATGNRVLITAHTDRALRELRSQLPRQVVELCVSIVGRDRSDLQDLAVAARAIEDRAASHDETREQEQVTELRSRLDALRRERAKVVKELVSAREVETVSFELGPYRGTLAELERCLGADRDRFGWLEGVVPRSIPEDPPLSAPDALWLLDLLRDQDDQEEELARRALPNTRTLPGIDEFERTVEAERRALGEDSAHEGVRRDGRYPEIAALPSDVRSDLAQRIRTIMGKLDYLDVRPETWVAGAVDDALVGRVALWRRRQEELAKLLARAHSLLGQLGHKRVDATGDLGVLAQQAEALGRHLKEGGKLKRGLITPKPVKDAKQLLEGVRVDGARPDTLDRLTTFMRHVTIQQSLDAADRLWPSNVVIPKEETAHERLAWHQDEASVLKRVIEVGEFVDDLQRRFRELHLSLLDFRDRSDLEVWLDVLAAAESAEAVEATREPIWKLENSLDGLDRGREAAAETRRLLEAVRARDVSAYRRALDRIGELEAVNRAVAERESLLTRLEGFPRLARMLRESASEPEWEERLRALPEAWGWVLATRALAARDDPDPEELARRVDGLDEEINSTMQDLTANLAWSHAVSRLGQRQRQALKAYVLAIRKLGKGTGKYAPHRRREAREALQHCRPAVPGWVMPIYRIAETLDIQRDAFDVVIIDEASQASIEAAFLQYLAPKIVVVGDDKQVSPAGVGIDQSQLIGLRRQYLEAIPYSATYENPETSFFDQAKIRYGRLLTLREHFRSMPEIISFSNRIAYEPDGVPLIPLRQYGTDRLDPIKSVYVSDGYELGTSGNKINPPEIDMVVEAVLKCCADPAYDGKTMGVISLTGAQQADEISRRLLQELDPTEIASRELRCGMPPDFQGSERHVMFLSMVAAPTPGQRMGALTRELYLQRFNVAASRAQDQMWLFHSMRLEDLPNKEDMRYQLLDYCLRMATDSRPAAREASNASVSNDVLDPRFDSLFEQHVYNQIVERGYLVIPQHDVQGFKIDLVVVGGRSRVGVECDGEVWHGPEQYESDIARQRELQRCGWTFFRVRGSVYYRNAETALEPLWDLLEAHEIYPVGSRPPPVSPHSPAGLSAEVVEDHDEGSTGGDDRVFQDPRLGGEDEPPADPEAPDSEAVDPEAPDSEASLLDLLTDGGDEEEEGRLVKGTFEVGDPEGGERAEETDSEPHGGGYGLQPYSAWTGRRLPDPRTAARADLVNGLLEIVQTEGPIVGERAYRLFVQASGGQRLAKQSTHALNKAAAQAVRGGMLAAANPTGAPGQKAQTLYIPDSPAVVLRKRGPRDLVEIPPGEVAELMRRISVDLGPIEDESLYREVLRVYELVKLTAKAETFLRSCRSLLP